MEWADDDDVVRGVALAGIGQVLLGLREEPAVAAASKQFGFTGAQGRLIGFHDPDGRELSFYAVTEQDGVVRSDAMRPVRLASGSPTAAT
jgi:hypothetical protein